MTTALLPQIHTTLVEGRPAYYMSEERARIDAVAPRAWTTIPNHDAEARLERASHGPVSDYWAEVSRYLAA